MDSSGAPSCPELRSRMCRGLIALGPHALWGKRAKLCEPLRLFLVKALLATAVLSMWWSVLSVREFPNFARDHGIPQFARDHHSNLDGVDNRISAFFQ